MHVYLDIKVASLAHEARLIRRKRRAILGYARYLRRTGAAALQREDEAAHGLYEHLRDVVTPEARAAHLARTFLRGRATYLQAERSTRPGHKPDWKRVKRLVQRYGEGTPSELAARLDAWAEATEVQQAAAA